MSDDEGYDEVEDLLDQSSRSRNLSTFNVSGWDNDDDGIEKDPNPHETPDKELLWAAEHSVIQVVRKIVEQNPELVHARDKDGYTPLHRACYNDHVDIVKYLLMNGARHDAQTNERWQPLHSACRWNSLKCAAALISFGADINAKTDGGITPLHLAAQQQEGKHLIQLLLSQPEIKGSEINSGNDTPIDIARRSGRLEKYFEVLDPCFV
uniref:Ankyrin repeat domain-containing protein 49 n=1 Tax=Lygus hesperus TaxID=30085 RepID=A0A0A9XAM8_LYGHE